VVLPSANERADNALPGGSLPGLMRIFISTALLLSVATSSLTTFAAVPETPGSQKHSPAITGDNATTQIKLLGGKIRAHPGRAPLYLERGNLYLHQQRHELALADYQQAIALDPGLDRAWYGRGMAYGRLGQLNKAIADMSEYIRRQPRDSMGYTKRGVRYMWAGEVEKAYSDYQTAIGLNANNAEAHDDIGVIYANRQQFRNALKHFTRALEIDPIYQKAYYNRALTLLLMGRDVLALSDIERSLELRADDRSALKLKAAILESLGHDQAAKEIDEFANSLTDRSWHEQHELSN
jgi:tetratricopeptide (TPR) repeat protein